MSEVRFDRRFLRFSPQEVDPLSWITGSMVPLVFGALNLVYGVVFTAVTWGESRFPWLQAIAVALCTVACLVIQALTRPLRPPLGWRGAALALGIAVAGALGSAIAYAGTTVSIEVWWAPFGLALVIASLAPYLPARLIALLGTAAAVIAVTAGAVAVGGRTHGWGPVSTVLIIASPLISGIVATVAFSTAVVARMLPLLDARSQTMLALDAPRGEENERAERARLANLIAQAAPFIERIAERGEVTPADRSLAGQLARRLRDDLVSASSLTWLDAVANERVVVVDPDRRAERMRPSQRTALRALVRAILELPGADAGSLLVELRDAPDGSTAVGVSLDAELPEGRRQLHLAPYYLALRGSVDDLRLLDDTHLRVTFNLPPEG